MRIVILAAGVGSRLGNPSPKPLTPLSDGRSILGRQLDQLERYFDTSTVSVVVGFKKELIMEAFPDVSFVYNQDYGETNTSKSLLKGLRSTGAESVLWLNGDVVFDDRLVPMLLDHMTADRSFVAVNTAPVGVEEVTYLLDSHGDIAALSKALAGGAGEALGVNYVSAEDKPLLVERLVDCDDDDYFERAIEMVINKDGRRFVPVDVSDAFCVEVDFRDDLQLVNDALDQDG